MFWISMQHKMIWTDGRCLKTNVCQNYEFFQTRKDIYRWVMHESKRRMMRESSLDRRYKQINHLRSSSYMTPRTNIKHLSSYLSGTITRLKYQTMHYLIEYNIMAYEIRYKWSDFLSTKVDRWFHAQHDYSMYEN